MAITLAKGQRGKGEKGAKGTDRHFPKLFTRLSFNASFFHDLWRLCRMQNSPHVPALSSR